MTGMMISILVRLATLEMLRRSFARMRASSEFDHSASLRMLALVVSEHERQHRVPVQVH